MARNPNREIDKTHLSIDQAEARGFIHRDYIAHCLRWTYVVRYLYRQSRYKKARILDVGCGREVPLAKLLHSSRLAPTEGWYLGVDYNGLDMPIQFANTSWQPHLVGEVDASDMAGLGEAFELTVGKKEAPTLVTCFEVLEHMTPAKCRSLLVNFQKLAQQGAEVILSTPVWDPKTGAADNHINEMTYHALRCLLADVGFGFKAVYGTFASQSDLKPSLEEAGLISLFKQLGEYYDSNYLSTIFAPLFPAFSRNCLWHLTGQPDLEQLPSWTKVPGPWSNHPDWEQLKGVPRKK